MTFTTIRDLTDYIEGLMGSMGSRGDAERMARAAWSDGAQTESDLSDRWPNDDAFFAEWCAVGSAPLDSGFDA